MTEMTEEEMQMYRFNFKGKDYDLRDHSEEVQFVVNLLKEQAGKRDSLIKKLTVMDAAMYGLEFRLNAGLEKEEEEVPIDKPLEEEVTEVH